MSQRILFAAMMSLVLSFLMTFFVTWLNLGFGPHFASNWMAAFRVAWPAAGTISFLFGPVVLRASLRLDAHLQPRLARGR
ncbi:DUF2798 domain-containing protein [Poseidonocella sp. HB161398]|uniref:DUF2798 domain-containing protein n=1 Tax=Poseidonocella sp. HB161398 TaxID=2320855 RepID=UPI0011082143|nr:DUF2798 domain-containing protein [Poseidonocella sp. HB161398]